MHNACHLDEFTIQNVQLDAQSFVYIMFMDPGTGLLLMSAGLDRAELSEIVQCSG